MASAGKKIIDIVDAWWEVKNQVDTNIKYALQIFDDLDKSTDGILQPSELSDSLRDRFSSEEIASLFQHVDRSRDGTVDRDEWLEGFGRYMEVVDPDQATSNAEINALNEQKGTLMAQEVHRILSIHWPDYVQGAHVTDLCAKLVRRGGGGSSTFTIAWPGHQLFCACRTNTSKISDAREAAAAVALGDTVPRSLYALDDDLVIVEAFGASPNATRVNPDDD